MRAKIYVMSTIVLLGLLSFAATRQFVADLYWIMAHQDGNEPKKTIGYLEKSIAIDNNNASFHFSLGRTFLQKGLGEVKTPRQRNRWVRKSVGEFQRAIELEPSHSDYHFHLGISYAYLGYPPLFYWKVIQDSFTRAAMLNPTHVRRLYAIGMYYLHEYDRLIKIGPNIETIGSFNHKDYAEFLKNNHTLYFRKLLDVNEEYLPKILRECYSVTRSYEDLKAVIRNTASDHSSFAHFLDGKGMWEKAEREYREAIDLEPENSIHYSRFAHAFFRRKKYVEAINWWQKQKLIDPENGNPYLFLTDSFMKLKRFDDALRELHDLMRLYPKNAHYQIKLIRTLMKADRVDEAIKEYHKILERNPNLSKQMYDSVLYFQKRGDYKKAAKVLNKALISALNR